MPRGASSQLTPSDRAARRRLAIAALLSLLAHAAAAVVLAARPAPGIDAPARLTLAERPDEPEIPKEDDNRVRLGSPTSQATSITWIGADEPEPAAAPTGDVDQAAFRTEVAAAPTPETFQPPSPPVPEPRPAPPEPVEVAEAKPEPAPPATAFPETPDLDPIFTASPAPMGPPLPPAPEEQPEAPRPEIEQQSVERPSDDPQPAQDPARPEAPESPPAPEPGAQPSEKAVGEVAERESDFSSTIRAPVAKLGKPLAAQGLEILTVAPRFSHYTQITAAPRDPVVRVHFDRSGRARKVELVRSSGVRDVDRPVLDAVYQWRARGKQLERLPEPGPEAAPGSTLTVEISILL